MGPDISRVNTLDGSAIATTKHPLFQAAARLVATGDASLTRLTADGRSWRREVEVLEPDLLGQGPDEVGLGDRARLDEDPTELLARPGLLVQGRVELGLGQEALAHQQRAERRSVGHGGLLRSMSGIGGKGRVLYRALLQICHSRFSLRGREEPQRDYPAS